MGLERRVDSIKELNAKKQKQEEVADMATESQLGIVAIMGELATRDERMDEIELGIIELMGKIGGQ